MASLCRICLLDCNARMYEIGKTRYREMYEKHTGATLTAGSGVPSTVCYLCNALILKFYRFLRLAQKAERYLRERLNGIEFIEENVSVLDRALHPFYRTEPDVTSIAPDVTSTSGLMNSEDNEVSVKIESLDHEEALVYEDMDAEGPTQNTQNEDTHNEDTHQEPIALAQNESNQIAPSTNNQAESVHFEYDPDPSELFCFHKTASVILERIPIDSIKEPSEVDLHHYCKKCDYKCVSTNMLKQHLKVHDKRRAYACKSCSYRFHTVHDLTNHEIVHEKCRICGKIYAKPLYLKRHMKLHRVQKQHACKTCLRTFNHKSTFLVHMRTHTGEKPFSCTWCDKSFNDKSNCRKHVKTHSEELLTQCSLCPLSFSQKRDLQAHVMEEHIL